jgi:hypothetical protein
MSERRKPSGAAYRRARRERQLEALRREAAKLGAQVLTAGEVEALRRDAAGGRSTASPRLAAILARLPEPTGEPTENIYIASCIATALLVDLVHDPHVDGRERRRVGADLVRTIGMTFSRAQTQAKLREIAARIVPELAEQAGEEIEPGEWTRRRRDAGHPHSEAITAEEWDRLGGAPPHTEPIAPGEWDAHRRGMTRTTVDDGEEPS